jgi:hypothetical protein
MQLDRFTQFANHAIADGAVFYHSGHLDGEMVAAIGALLRRRLQEEGASRAQARKVFTTFMEMAQNIVHYAAVTDEDGTVPAGKFGALSVVRSPEGFEVMCGNYLAAEQVPRVRGRLESVQVMGPEKVRLAYRRQLAFEGEDPDSKGAGLGLLTMAASAREPIEFAFDPDHPAQDEKSFLFLKTVI